MSKSINIAIDGPAGAGKSSAARLIAKEMNYTYIDTGAMYRAIALQVIRQGIDIHDEQRMKKMLSEISIDLAYTEDGQQQIFLNGEDVSLEIRKPDVGNLASPVSQIPLVREILVHLQKQLALNGGVVMDGRDIGSNVLPNAECKIYLTADVAERARRRWLELQAKGSNATLEQVQADIEQRDKNDCERKLNPLVKVADAHLIDSTNLSLAEVVQTVVRLAKAVLAEHGER